MAAKKLTKTVVDGIKAPATGYALTWDSEIKGFGLRVTAAGSKAFIMQKRINGKDHRVTLGRYGEITAEQARKLALAHVGVIASGGDPVADKARKEIVTKTLQEVLEDYIGSRKDMRPATIKDMRHTLQWGSKDWMGKPVSKFTRDMVENRHADVGKDAPAAANKWARYLRALWNYASARYTDSDGNPVMVNNPVKVLSTTRAWYRVERRKTCLEPHQIKPWWEAVTALHSATARDYLRLLLLTGLRKEEGLGLLWANVDFAARTLTVKDTKNHEDHTLPMGEYLASMIQARPRLGERVFMTERGKLSNTRYFLDNIKARTGQAFMLHDARRTFATIAESLDIPSYALKALLNHKTRESDVTSGYLQITAERLRTPMQRIEDFILKAAGELATAEIVELREAR